MWNLELDLLAANLKNFPVTDDSDYSHLPALEDYEEDDCEIPPLLDDIDLNALFVESVEEKTEISEEHSEQDL